MATPVAPRRTGRANAAMVWVSAPGDYAILNSNHTSDDTADRAETH